MTRQDEINDYVDNMEDEEFFKEVAKYRNLAQKYRAIIEYELLGELTQDDNVFPSMCERR